MKSRIIWAAILLAVAAGFYVVTIRPTQTHSPGFSRKNPPLRHLKPPDITPPPIPQPEIAMPTITPPPLAQTLPLPSVENRREERKPLRMEVPIPNGGTIDFGKGEPQVIFQGEDQKALERSLKEMAEATKDITFQPKK